MDCELVDTGDWGFSAGGGFCPRPPVAKDNATAAAKEIAGRVREGEFIKAPMRLRSVKLVTGAE